MKKGLRLGGQSDPGANNSVNPGQELTDVLEGYTKEKGLSILPKTIKEILAREKGIFGSLELSSYFSPEDYYRLLEWDDNMSDKAKRLWNNRAYAQAKVGDTFTINAEEWAEKLENFERQLILQRLADVLEGLPNVLESLPEVSKLKKEVFASIIDSWKESNDGVNENEVLDGILDELGLEKNKETRYIAYQRLYSLRNESLKNYLEKKKFSEEESKKLIDKSLVYTANLHAGYNKKFLEKLEKLENLPSFYLELLKGIFELSNEFNNFFINWNNHILEQNKELAEKYGDKESVLEYLKKSDLQEKDDNGEVLSFSHSVLIDGKMVSYAEAFENDIKQILSRLDKLIQSLSKYNNEEAENYVVYLQTLKEALAEKDVKKLSSKWKKVDETWMNVEGPFQMVHMMEYYEDTYRKSVTPYIDIRISNSGKFDSNVSKSIEGIFEKFYKKMCPNDEYPEVYQLSKKGYKSVQIHIGEPLIGGGKFYNGYPAAQIVPNDDEISKKHGKKVFSFPEDSLEWRKKQATTKLAYLIYDEAFLSGWYSLFEKEDLYFTTEDFLIIGHEFGHALWLAKGTESAIDEKTGNFKNIEEWKATTGGLMMLFNGNYDEEVKKYVILNHARRTIAWLRIKKVLSMRSYYNEALIDLELLYKSGVLKINNGKVIFDYTEENYEKLKEIYTKEYEELIKLYLERKDAGEFLYKFVEEQEDDSTLPKDKKLKEFVVYYHNLADKLGAETININSTKEKVLAELDNPNFPNLKFLFSDEALDIAPELLKELLEQEKEEFKKLLEIPKEKINFDILMGGDHKLGYFWNLLLHLQDINKGEKIDKIIEDFEQDYEDFQNMISYSKAYYELLVYCFENCKLDEEQKRILELEIKDFKSKGINLPEEKLQELQKIDKEIYLIQEKYRANVMKDKKAWSYEIEDDTFIKNLPSDILEITRKRAEEQGKTGYIFTLDPNEYFVVLEKCDSSNIRREFYFAFNSVSSNGEFSNKKNVLKLLKLRKEKAFVLGKENFAEFVIQDNMASTPENAQELIESIWKKAKIKAKKEVDELKEYFGLEQLEVWDLYYYGEKYKKELYDLDTDYLKRYFTLDNTLDYLFNFVKQFYGLDFKQIDVSVYNEDVRVYEVRKNGKLISYFFLDPFSSKTKRGGAWAEMIRKKTKYNQVSIVLNATNSLKGENNKSLLTLSNLNTLFHEFGHALHAILSNSKYNELSGFNVESDFIEFPSQIQEKWQENGEDLRTVSKHYETGEKLPYEIANKIDELGTFLLGNWTIRQNEFALFDLYIHTHDIPESTDEFDELYLKLINEYSIFQRDNRYTQYTNFSHLFGGAGYEAGYYSYMWADVLVSDAWKKIKKEGMFDTKVGQKFMDTILAQGAKKPARELFEDFMGRDVDPKAFMEEKELI